MRQVLVEEIIGHLSFDEGTGKVFRKDKFSAQEWERAVRWLHNSGLALYFWNNLKEKNATGSIPLHVSSQLEYNLAANGQRSAYMLDCFKALNEGFSKAGVRYAAVKGFSLVPDFCPDPSFRPTGDLDYLVEEESLPVARRVVEQAGYCLTHQVGQELMFSPRSLRKPQHDTDQYEADVVHTVELHVGIVDSEHDVDLGEKNFSASNTTARESNGSTFFALREEDAFLLQVRHAFVHLVNYWLRISWLYEIGYFLLHKENDASFWLRLEREIDKNAVLRDVVVVIAELSSQLFHAPLSPLLQRWAAEIRPAARVWIDNYARNWILDVTPGSTIRPQASSKLVLFLHQQFMSDEKSQRQASRVWLVHPRRLSRIAQSMKAQPKMILRSHFWRRGMFHAICGLRYLLEVPRWRYLNWRAARPASRNAGYAR